MVSQAIRLLGQLQVQGRGQSKEAEVQAKPHTGRFHDHPQQNTTAPGVDKTKAAKNL
jgi:hypothetical protein